MKEFEEFEEIDEIEEHNIKEGEEVELEELEEEEEEETTGGGQTSSQTYKYYVTVNTTDKYAYLGRYFSGKIASCTSASSSNSKVKISKRTSSQLVVYRTSAPVYNARVTAKGKKLNGSTAYIYYTINFK